MHRLFCIIIIVLVTSCSKDKIQLFNTSPDLAWNMELDFTGQFDIYGHYTIGWHPQSIAATPDNGVIIIQNGVLAEYDDNGNRVTLTSIIARNIITTNDGYLVHLIDSLNSEVALLDFDLNIIWRNFSIEWINSLLAISDGYLVTHKNIDSEVMISKLTTSGDIEWQTKFDRTGDLNLNMIQETTDGYIAIGSSSTTELERIGQEDTWIVRLNSNGDILWEKLYGTEENDRGVNIFQLDNGNFLSVSLESAWSSNYYDNSLIMVLDENGKIKKSNKIDDVLFYSMIPTNDGDFIVVGDTYEPVIAKINQNGKRKWQKEVRRTTGKHTVSGVIQTTDGGFVALGNEDDYNFYLFKVNPE